MGSKMRGLHWTKGFTQNTSRPVCEEIHRLQQNNKSSKHKDTVISFLLLNSAAFQWNKNFTFTTTLVGRYPHRKTAGVSASLHKERKKLQDEADSRRCYNIFGSKAKYIANPKMSAAFTRSQSGGSCEQTP